MGLQRVAQPRAASSVRRRQTRAALGRGASTWWAWVLALGVLLWTVPSAALSVPPLQGRVNDHAGMLNAAQRAQLEARLAQFEQSSKHQFALLTVRSLEGDAIEDFSIRVAEAWKLGDAQRDDGLILIIAAQERKVRIEVGYGLEGNIPDAIAGRVIRQVIAPEFRQGRHAQGINNAFELLMKAATGQELPPQAAAQAPRKQTRDLPIFGVLLLLGLLFGWFGRGGGGGAAALWLAANALSGGRGGGGGGRGYRGGGGGFGGGGASGGW